MSEYTDSKNNTYEVEQKCVYTEEERRELEDKIVEELYNIFKKS